MRSVPGISNIRCCTASGRPAEQQRLAERPANLAFFLRALTEFLGASLAVYGGVSPSGVSAGVARRSEWSGLAVDVLLDGR